jgi:hypothetical protein
VLVLVCFGQAWFAKKNFLINENSLFCFVSKNKINTTINHCSELATDENQGKIGTFKA